MPTQALVGNIELVRGNDIRDVYASAHRKGQTLATFPQVIDLLLAGKINLGT